MNRLPCIHLPELNAAGGLHRLDGVKSHHLNKVLRLAPGQRVKALNGKGLVAEGQLQSVGRTCEIDLEAATQTKAPAPLELWLPMIRPSRLETAVEKAVELGVSHIRPFISEYTGNQNRRLDSSRLERVMIAALEQSGNPFLPGIDVPQPLSQLLEESHLPLVLAYPEATGNLAFEMATLAETGCSLLAGPEGGFSPEEFDLVVKRARVVAGLGPHVLRAESALICLCGLFRALTHSH